MNARLFLGKMVGTPARSLSPVIRNRMGGRSHVGSQGEDDLRAREFIFGASIRFRRS